MQRMGMAIVVGVSIDRMFAAAALLKAGWSVRVFWARQGAIEACFDALALWRERASNVDGQVLDATHYMTEEMPEDIASRMADFFAKNQAMEAAE